MLQIQLYRFIAGGSTRRSGVEAMEHFELLAGVGFGAFQVDHGSAPADETVILLPTFIASATGITAAFMLPENIGFQTMYSGHSSAPTP